MIATIDFETTGFKAGEDEVLQVSIIDEDYNVLLNSLEDVKATLYAYKEMRKREILKEVSVRG